MAARERQKQRRSRRELIVEAVLLEARPLLLDRFRMDSCIASTRVAIDVFKAFGIGAKPLPVRVFVFNGPLWARMQAGERPKAGDIRRLYDEDGSWSVGIGFGEDPKPGRWPGHLAAYIPSLKLLVDLSLDQGSRPERGIVLAPVALPVDAAFLKGGERSVVTFEETVVAYELAPDAPDWRYSPDWADRSRSVPLVEQLVEAVRRSLAGSGRQR